MCCSRIACRHLLREHLPQAMQRGAQRAALAMHKALVGEVAAAVGRYAKPLPGLDAGAAARRGGRARPGELSPPRCRRGGGGPCCCASGRPRSPTRPSCACACRACRPTRTRTRRASCAGRRRRRDGCCGGRDDHLHRRRRGGCGGCGRVCRLRLRRRAGCADRDRADRTGRSRGRAGRSRSRGRSRRGRSRARARSRGRRALDRVDHPAGRIERRPDQEEEASSVALPAPAAHARPALSGRIRRSHPEPPPRSQNE
mmetsp:Transcript_22086/g.48148  ORF Transcript_22086/g.48148 Transcript_22086/m.48148 type:complete len:257 (-) Transcript_22086:321-1091(-)